MKPEIHDDERDHEIGGAYYNGLIPGHGPFDFDEDRQPGDEGNNDGDCHEEDIDIAEDVLTPQTVPIDPITAGYEISEFAGSRAVHWEVSAADQFATFQEGEAHLSARGILRSWTPREGSCEPEGPLSNVPVEVDALSFGQLLWRCRGYASVVWMDGFHALNLSTAVAILDADQRLRSWLPLP